MSSSSHLSKDFFDLVKAIGESKSKQEEDRIILEEMEILKGKLPSADKKKLKELLVRLLYVEMLGHDASWGYIKAVELTASQNLLQKRVGYLIAGLCLSPDHDFRFMLCSQLQKDLHSSNYLEVCASLTAICRLLTVDMMPALTNDVSNLLRHEIDLVRKKTVMVLHRFHQLDNDSIKPYIDDLRRTLCDKDPSVMGAALCILYDIVKVNPGLIRDLVPSFVSILKQIIEHRLPRDYDFHRIPAPWIQMQLLRILALLGRGDQVSSEGMYEILVDVMRRADTGINVGYAVLYECVKCITSIYPNNYLLDQAASYISRFISSETNNLKYIGVKALAAIVKDHPNYAAAHQLAVIDCLEDPDETLKRKTLELLHQMTNPVNIEFITDKLLSFLKSSSDIYLKKDLVNKISQSAERFAPSNIWYVQTMAQVLILAGDLVNNDVVQNLLQLIAEGGEEEDDDDNDDDEDPDEILKIEAVETFLECLDKPVLSNLLIQTLAWILGEYGSLSESTSLDELMNELCDLAIKPYLSFESRGYLLTSLMKLTAQAGECPPKIIKLAKKYSLSIDLDLQQKALEFLALLDNPSIMVRALPMDASCEDIDVDENLSFLDHFVENALSKGALPYTPPLDDDDDSDIEDDNGTTFNITPYEKPQLNMNTIPTNVESGLPVESTENKNSIVNTNQASINSTGGMGILSSGGTGFSFGNSTANVWGRPKPNEDSNNNNNKDNNNNNNNNNNNDNDIVTNINSQSHNDSPLSKEDQPYSFNETERRPSLEYEKPKELSEREKMAQSLFGGISNDKNKKTGRTRTRRKRNKDKNKINDNKKIEDNKNIDENNENRNDRSDSTPAQLISQPIQLLFDDDENNNNNNNNNTEIKNTNSGTSTPTNLLDDLLDISNDTSSISSQSTLGANNNNNNLIGNIDLLAPTSSNNNTLSPTSLTSDKIDNNKQETKSIDPFEESGLIGSVTNVSLSSSSYLNYQNETIQPLNINTAEFGSKWGQSKAEQKNPSNRTTVKKLEELNDQIKNLGFHSVEMIHRTNEAIFASTIRDSFILLHAKLSFERSTFDFIIKSKNPSLTSAISQQVKSNIH